ncbi:MAG: AAA family ATPase [Candidatus Bathyarchaeota archaeon]|nr:AAA family ATPase [Candidatus Termiticorpusculum sp.]
MPIRRRIGLVYLPGALPCFEDFGNLPTDLVGKDGQVDGKPASDILDMMIIPGGSLIESQSVNPVVSREILKMADAGKFILGICSGLQVLAKRTDVGRLSTVPIVREGLGLIDVEVQPLVCTDQVNAHVVGKSFLSDIIDKEVLGFHCHTYGKVILQGDSRSVLVSHVQRVNYRKMPQDLVSGVANREGNVVGVFVHALLDRNPILIESLMEALDVNQVELEEIRKVNAKLVSGIKGEIGINTNIYPTSVAVKKSPVMVLVTALGSGSGKTFLVTGMAGALKRRGYNVGLIKIGGDVRDSVPALYLVKGSMQSFASIKIGESGWLSMQEAISQACGVHDFLFVEGAMSAFTGLLNGKISRPASTLEVAASLGASVIVIVTCDKEGVEGGLVNVLNYVNTLRLLGVNPVGVILNKMSTSYLTEEDNLVIRQALENVGVRLLGVVPNMRFERRGMIPEVEICYNDFGVQALDVAERYIDLERLVKLAKAPSQNSVDYAAFVEKFKKLLINYPSNFSSRVE